MRWFVGWKALFWGLLMVHFAESHSPERRQAYLVADLDSGKILKKKNATSECYPASLTKMMTLYLVFGALAKHQIQWTTTFTASKLASQQMRSRLGVVPGEKLTVKTLVEALIVKSANDAAVVLAEGIAGSVPNFVQRMNAKAQQLKMTHTVFRNPSGVPDDRQVSTAKDMAILTRALWRDFPRYSSLFRLRSFVYKKKTHYTHNFLLNTLQGSDGMKTGYIAASGYNIVTTVTRYDDHHRRRRFLCVYFGGKSGFARDQAVISLFEPILIDQQAMSYDIKSARLTQFHHLWPQKSDSSPLLVRASICSSNQLERLLKQYSQQQQRWQKSFAAKNISTFLNQVTF